VRDNHLARGALASCEGRDREIDTEQIEELVIGSERYLTAAAARYFFCEYSGRE
jgi:hypothetical protein